MRDGKGRFQGGIKVEEPEEDNVLSKIARMLGMIGDRAMAETENGGFDVELSPEIASAAFGTLWAHTTIVGFFQLSRSHRV